jgi:hypothetical protein
MRPRIAGRAHGLARPVLFATFAVATGCGTDRTLEPLPPPVLAANATALANLEAVEALERATGRDTVLIAVSGRIDRSGRPPDGEPWYYTFRDPSDRPETYYQWRVDGAGLVTVEHLATCGFGVQRPIGSPAIDSDRAVALTLEAGGGAVLDAGGVTAPRFGIRYSAGTMRVELLRGCTSAYVSLDARTGEVQHANFRCVHGKWGWCWGPGVY